MKKDNNYFELLKRSAGFCEQIATALESVFESFDAFKLKGYLDELHAIEHAADDSKHDIMEKLAHEFITPIEREDLVALTAELDNVTDCIEDILRKFYMMNVTSLRNDTAPHTKLIVTMTHALNELMDEFVNYKKSKTIKDIII